MTMRNLMWAVLAASCLLTAGSAVWATDTVRLGGPSVKMEGTTDPVHFRRGFYGGGHFGRGYYGRSYYGAYYGRGYYGGGYYRPYYYPRSYAYYSSYYYPSYYYPSYYSYPTYYYSSAYCYPIAGETVAPPATTLQQRPQPYVPPMPPPDPTGTYQYDGDPRTVVPMPNLEPSPSAPPRILPVDGRLVSLPTKMTGSASPVGLPATPKASPPAPRYPAYGEEPIAPAPRK